MLLRRAVYMLRFVEPNVCQDGLIGFSALEVGRSQIQGFAGFSSCWQYRPKMVQTPFRASKVPRILSALVTIPQFEEPVSSTLLPRFRGVCVHHIVHEDVRVSTGHVALS
jgi:hypothetical protein